MKITLPHLPYNLDIRIGLILRDFIVSPKSFALPLVIKDVNMDNLKKKKGVKPIDLSTIFGVVRTDKLELVENLIKEKGSNILNEYDDDGFTPMHWAAFEGSTEIVKFLIEQNVLIDSTTNKALQSPLHWACAKGRMDVASLLIEKGANIDTRDNKGYTPLITSSQYGHTALIAYLVSRGAKLESEDNNGDNALHWAVYRGHPDATRLLIIYGLNPKMIDKFGQTVLHLACLSGNLNIVQHLIEQDCIDTEIRDKNGKKAIDLAKVRGYSDVVDFINRHSSSRKDKFCNLKTFLFGPVGNSKYVFYFIHLLYWCYEYPTYFYRVLPNTWEEHKFINILFILNTFLMWFFFYSVHLAEPGYLKQNTREYQSYLRKITLRSESFNPSDWNKTLARLCHTCKTVKPYRASHCRACNRCVLAYDHHCPYIQNCVGYKNRPRFFFFVLSTTTLQLISLRLILVCFSQQSYQYLLYPGLAIVVLFGFMVAVLTFSAASSAITNLTSNEVSKKKKYDYLRDYNGGKRSIFDKGLFYNIRYYFHLVEPSYLETEAFENKLNYTV